MLVSIFLLLLSFFFPARELYALWFEVTNCSCWLVLLQPRIPRLPPISQAYLVTYINAFLLFSIRLMFYKVLCCMFTYLYHIVSFSTMQPVSAFLFYYMATDGAASVNVSFPVIAKNHLIWFCKLFTDIRGLLYPVQLILGVKSTAFFTSKLFV